MVQDLYILMITAAVVSILFKLLKQPVVLGYIVAGVLVGPNLFGETFVNGANVKAWGDIGVLFVLFCIGLEFRLKNLISSGKVAAIGALTIIVGMMLFGYLVGVDADLDMVNSLFLAGMLCMSSTTIVMKAIDEAGMSKERFVKGATSILIVEDVVAVVLMVLLSSIAIRHQFEGAELAGKVVDLAITLAAWFVCGILIIPTLIRMIKKHLNDETLIILALGLCLGMVLTAEEAGFSSALGAFVMGSILAETVAPHRIEKLMTPLTQTMLIQYSANEAGLMSIPTEMKKMAAKTFFSGVISFSIRCDSMVSARIDPITKAPRALLNPASSAVSTIPRHRPRARIISVSSFKCFFNMRISVGIISIPQTNHAASVMARSTTLLASSAPSN